MQDFLMNNRLFRALDRIPVIGHRGSVKAQMTKNLIFVSLITVLGCAAMYGGFKIAMIGKAIALLIAIPAISMVAFRAGRSSKGQPRLTAFFLRLTRSRDPRIVAGTAILERLRSGEITAAQASDQLEAVSVL